VAGAKDAPSEAHAVSDETAIKTSAPTESVFSEVLSFMSAA
jgi:hypothetical protein